MALRWGWLLVPSLLVFSSLLVGSQFEIFRISFYEDLGLGRTGSQLTLVNYIAILKDPFYLNSISVTIRVSAIATALGVFLAFPLAYIIARMNSRWGIVMLAGVLLASFVTMPIKVLGLIIIFSKEGLLNKFLLNTHLMTEPVTLLGNEVGVIVGLIYYSIAFAVLILYSVVRTIPTSLEEAAKIHGCSNRRAFVRVVLPLCVPGIVAVSMTMFNLSMGGFVAAALIGTGRVLTLPVVIYQTIFVEAKYAIASTLSVILLVLVILINLLAVGIIAVWRKWLKARAKRWDADSIAPPSRSTSDGLTSSWAIGTQLRSFVEPVLLWGERIKLSSILNFFLIFCIYVFLLAPLFVVALASLNGGSQRAGSIYFPPHRISFDWYFATPFAHLHAFGVSLLLAGIASFVALLLALPIGFALARGRFLAKDVIEIILRTPLQIPFVIIGISFLYLYISIEKEIGISLSSSSAALIIAHIFVLTPYVIGSVTAVLQRFNLEIEEASLVHGADRWRTLRRVTLPVILPGIFAGTVYAFMVSFSDVPIALFLATPSFVTLPMLIYQSMQVDFDATVLSTSTAVMLLGMVLLVVAQRIIGLDSLAQADAGRK
jgi:ABC-type spermidine/putrescine transport system permease subunit II